MDHNIDRLRYAALELLIRLSKRFGRKRASTIFLVNNLHHIVQVAPHTIRLARLATCISLSCIAGACYGTSSLSMSWTLLAHRCMCRRCQILCTRTSSACSMQNASLSAAMTVTPNSWRNCMARDSCAEWLRWPDSQICMQLLREAASRGGQMAHAPGTSPPPPTAPLGASGAETIKEFEVHVPVPYSLEHNLHTQLVCPCDISSTPAVAGCSLNLWHDTCQPGCEVERVHQGQGCPEAYCIAGLLLTRDAVCRTS